MARVKEVSSVIVRNCKREESWTFPNDIFGIWKSLNVLYNGKFTRKMTPRITKKNAKAISGRTFLILISLIKQLIYHIIPKIAIHRSIRTCPIPISTFPVILSYVPLPS